MRRRQNKWRKHPVSAGFPIVSNGRFVAFVAKNPQEPKLLEAAKYTLEQIQGLARGNIVEATIRLNEAITEYYK